MIEATQRKLGEARFFYEHLVNAGEQTFKAFRHDPAAFRYYFSAFIQAARNVTWVLHNEEKDKWEAWEPIWKAKRTEEEQKLLDLTNQLRLDEVKRGGATPIVEFEEVAVSELLSANFDLQRRHPAYGVHVFAPPGTPSPKVRRQTYYFEHKDGKEEVVKLCKRYLEFIEKLVNDFCVENG
jgi:hypothetical protein